MKKYIIAFVLGAIIFSGISGVTAYTIMANSIEFQSRNNNWNVNNVGDALNSLYTMKTSEDYSTDEKRVGTWINGKPLYQKTISVGALPNNDENVVQHGIENIDIVVSSSGVAYKDDYSSMLQLPHGNPNLLGGSISLAGNRNTIGITTGMDRSSYTNTYVTLQYTKTTDLSS